MSAAVNPPRRVFLHADDFGMNPDVNEGIVRGFAEGLLTSTSLLANALHVAPAIAAWRRLLEAQANSRLASSERRRKLGDSSRPFDLGIHLNLSQGRPLTAGQYPHELLDGNGLFPGIVGVFRRLRTTGTRYRAAVTAELSRQIELMFDLGVPPTHLNGHQYIEMTPGVVEILPELLAKYRIPVVRIPLERRLFSSTLGHRFQVLKWALGCVKQSYARRFRSKVAGLQVRYPQAYFGAAHAGEIDAQLMQSYLDGSEAFRSVEICMHPAESPMEKAPSQCDLKDGWGDPLATKRSGELELLCSLELFEMLESHRLGLGRLSELENFG